MNITSKTTKKLMFINGASVLDMDVEQQEFYIPAYDGECMQKVNFNDFIKDALKYKDVCVATWNKDLKNEYIDILTAIIEQLMK